LPNQFRRAASRPHAPASWISYDDGEAILLVIVLLVLAGGFAYAGKRLRARSGLRQPGGTPAGLPSMRVTAYALTRGCLWCFAVWAVFGFAFPAEPLPLNVISKLLCFVATIMLFAGPEYGATLSGVKA
jgi:hypothetical protein